jgi:hypothetical protein
LHQHGAISRRHPIPGFAVERTHFGPHVTQNPPYENASEADTNMRAEAKPLGKSHLKPTFQRYESRCPRKPGFALVVTLSLMILLTIIAVGLLTLSSVSLRTSAQGAAMATARANARMALFIAIGELQKNTGPDQRITARAEILDRNPGTEKVDDVNQPDWAGVWKTGPDAPDVASGGAPQRKTSLGSLTPTGIEKSTSASWLVSNPAPATAIDPISWTGQTGSTAVVLATLGTPARNVLAPVVQVSKSQAGGASGGKYAYWVSDESVKAKVNIKDPTLAASPSGKTYIKNLTHFATSQAAAVHKVLPAPLDTDLRNNDKLAKVISLESLKLLSDPPSTTSTATYSPDVTAYSMGVLADVRNGGLKKDLTAAFEDDRTNNSGQYAALKKSCGSGMDAQCVYRSTSKYQAVPPKSASPVNGSATMDGLRWRSLYLYYNLYKNSMSLNRTTSNSSSPSGIQSADLGLSSGPYSVAQRVPSFSEEDGLGSGGYLMDPIAPLILQARVDIALESFVDPGSGKYRLRLRYHPMMVLWNPFSVRITANPSPAITFYTNLLNINGRWQTTITVGGTAAQPFGSPGYSLIQGSNYPLKLVSSATETVSFEPGEIKVLALAGDVKKLALGEPSSLNVCNIQNLVSADANLSADWAQYYDLPWPGTSNANDVVKVDVSNKNLTANATYTSGGPFNAWPDGNTNWNNRFASYNIPGATPSNTWPSPAISTMNGTPYLLVGFNYRAKGIQPTTDPNYYNAAFNPPMFMGNSSGFTNMDSSYGGYWRELYARCFKVYGTVNEVQMDGAGDATHHTSWGSHSVGVDPVGTGNSRLVLKDIPVQPLFSLGQFMHLAPRYYAGSGAYSSESFGENFIGGSFASPNVSLDQTTNNAGTNLLMDHSFMANQALFDTYFFSTVPAAKQSPTDSDKYVMSSSDLDTAIEGYKPLPNNRMRFHRKNGAPPKKEDLRNLKKAAANLMVDGAFNVNSTSVNAWRALISSLSGNDIRLWNTTASSAATLDSSVLKNPIPRFWSNSKSGGVNQPWEGMRALSDDEVTELATRIVQEVKTRGPFLSMADFLNRRLAPSATTKAQLYTMGALQAAIENTSPNINAVAKSAGTTVSLDPALSGDPFGANAFGNPATAGGGTTKWDTVLTSSNTSLPTNTATGIPGYLMQQDLVQAFAPVMTTRSDTFVIRCYGEATDPADTAIARAWCEAVIQRVPDFVDQSDPALAAGDGDGDGDATPLADLNEENQTFGRRLEIASFRWLNSSEL